MDSTPDFASTGTFVSCGGKWGSGPMWSQGQGTAVLESLRAKQISVTLGEGATVLRQCFNLTSILVRSLTSSRQSSNFDLFHFLFHFLFRFIFIFFCLVLAVFRTNPSGRQHACMASHMSQLYAEGRSLILRTNITQSITVRKSVKVESVTRKSI